MPSPRHVDGLARELLLPLFDANRASRSAWRVVGWDAEQGITVTLARGDTNLLVELEKRDDARDCFARTSRFNVCVRHAFRAGSPLEERDRRAVEQLVRLVETRESLLPEVERQSPRRRAEVREIEVDRVLVSEGAGHWYVNPYVGCMIGCEFCYVAERADFSRELEGLPELPWGRWVDVKVNAPEVLAREVRGAKPGIVRLSPIVTDPYQPLERHYRITRRCLEVLCEAGFSPVVLTRAALVTRDLELLAKCRSAAVGVSIPTDDDAVRTLFEPGADPIEERIAALEACARAGIPAFAVVQPMLPMNAERLVERLAPLVRAVRVDRMHVLSRARPLYEQAKLESAAEEGFFENTRRALVDGFRARGVAVDDLDDLAGALGMA